MSYVYLYEDPKTQLPRYVGKGQKRRMFTHLDGSHNNRLNNTIKKRLREGFEVRPKVICSGLSSKAACAVEIFWIAVLGREDLGTGPLFNRTAGGDGAAGVVGKTQVSWNKGKKTGPNLKLQGVPLAKEAIAKRTESRRLNNGGRYCKPMTEAGKANIKSSWDKRRELYGPTGRKSA